MIAKKRVSVSEDAVVVAAGELRRLPYVDKVQVLSKISKTLLMVTLSDLAEPSDMEEMESLLREMTGETDAE